MTYAEKLKNPKWQKRRLQILERDNWECRLCGDNKNTLHVHHLKYSGEPWDAPGEYLITYCDICHSLVEHIKSVRPNSIPVKTFVFFTKGEEYATISCIVKEDANSISHSFFIYQLNTITKDDAFLIALPPSAIKTLHEYGQQLKSNIENGE